MSMGMEMLWANIDDGFSEALLRAYRKGFLQDNEYQQLKQTTNISEFRLVLEDTDYGQDIAAVIDEHEFEVQVLRKSMKQKLMSELEYIIAQSPYPLNAFVTKMLHGFQIDNVVFIIEGLKGGRSLEELMRTADPLGYFPELKNIQPIDGDDYASLYQNLLVDLPVGVYFRKFLNEVTAGAATDENVEIDTKFIADCMQDYSLQQIQLRVRKIWLHEFYEFCQTQLYATSQEVMADLLKFESDLMTIQIIANSLSFSGLVNARNKEAERNKYISKIGYLYPARIERLDNVSDFKSLIAAVDNTPYEAMLNKVRQADGDRHEAESEGQTIDEVMLTEASRKFSEAFENGFHYGCFYAYFKLKLQEIENVCWLADLVTMNVGRNLPGWNKFIVPFKYHVDELQ